MNSILRPRFRTRATLVALASLSGCAELETSEQHVPITNPDVNSVPASVVQINIHGVPQWAVEYFDHHCTGVVVDRYWVLTAAHCFGDFLFPPEASSLSLTVAGNPVELSAVHFHPEAWSDGAESWTTTRPDPDSVIGSHDLALIRVDNLSATATPARLWHPADPGAVSLQGKTLKIAGLGTGAKTGHETAGANQNVSGDPVITGLRSPSGLEPGDSGGPAFVTLSGLPASTSFNKACAPTPGAANQEVVAGIHHAIQTGPSRDLFTPVYLPDNLDWIVGFLGDLDHDGVCDATDNCKTVANNQDNCNLVAETTASWESDGTILGDACDPTPCPAPSLHTTDFVITTQGMPYPSGEGIVTNAWGKQINDDIGILPILGKGAPISSSVQTLFCVCRTSAGVPIADPEVCAAAPFHCTLDPRHQRRPEYTEIGTGTPGVKQTYWHQITTHTDSTGPTKAAWNSLGFPGPLTKLATWDYVTDYTAWQAQGWIPTLPQDPKYGTVRDVVGSIWATTYSDVGNDAHGYPQAGDCFVFGGDEPVCSADDAFAHGVGAELRYMSSSYKRLPRYKPAPWWSYCAMCGDKLRFTHGEEVSNPAPFVTYDPASRVVTGWSDDRGAQVITEHVSTELMNTLADPTVMWIASSEPAAIAKRASGPRALLLATDGTVMKGELVRGATAFGLVPRVVKSTMTPRSKFAVAYSRVADAMFVAGGKNRLGTALSDVWTYRAGTWSSNRIEAGHDVSNVLASVFSHADMRLWIVTEAASGERRLIRLDPATGQIDTDVVFAALKRLAVPYLTTFEDGRVILAGQDRDDIAVHELGRGLRGTVSVAGSYTQRDTLVAPPSVASGTINLPVQRTLGDEIRIVVTRVGERALR